MKPRVDFALRFYSEVLGLDYLHYGMWAGEPLTLEGLRLAQARYVDNLLEMVPEGVRTILDVGCGTGAVAARFRDAGYALEGLSPDPYHGERFAERTGLPFHLCRFQDFAGGPFDMVLMSESCQYIPLDALFPTVRRVAPAGRLLLADYFNLGTGGGRVTRSGHLLDAFLDRAASAGWVVAERRDITSAVLPTLDLGLALADDHVLPALDLGRDLVRERYRLVYRLGRRWARRQLDRLMANRALLDKEEFEKWKRYEMMRLQLGSPQP